MDKETRISFETSVLFKHFMNISCQSEEFKVHNYFVHTPNVPDDEIPYKEGYTNNSRSIKQLAVYEYPAPSMMNLHLWFIKHYHMHVVIIPEYYTMGINYNWQVSIYDPKSDFHCTDDRSTGLYGDNGEYPEYHLALDAGLKKIIEILMD